MTSGNPERRTVLADAIDRHGADFAIWPDAALAGEARAAALADRALGVYRDDALTLARGLAKTGAALDADVQASGAAARVAEAVLARLASRPRRFPWVAVAAALVLAAGLGGVFDVAVLAPRDPSRFEVVTLDPLVFGMAEGESE